MRPGLAAAILGALLLTATATASTVEETLAELARGAGQGEPLVRIGLEASPVVRISSNGPFRLLDPATGRPVWREEFRGEIVVVADGAPAQGVPSVFRVQVGAFATREAAEAERSRLEAGFGAPAVVRYVPDRGSYRVRVGEASSRAALAPLLERLRGAGMQGVWIAEEPATESTGVTLRLVDASYDSRPTGLDRLVVVGDRPVEVEGKPYRGTIELRVSPFGTVRPINWVELETYLRGVVPAELGPEVWPQLEALRAQAVAARTYVWKNLGQFDDEGFDLCSTPRCQVYEGASAEHPLSDRAIAGTRHEILVWNGAPIAALYTATCGGHTEDGGAIFPEEEAPYLRGVPCRAEEAVREASRVVLDGLAVDVLVDDTGYDVTRPAVLLAAAGILDRLPSPAESTAPIGDAELRLRTAALARATGRPEPTGPPRPAGTLAQAALAIVADLGWGERGEVLLEPGDAEVLLRDAETRRLAPEARRALATLVWAEAVRPHPSGRYGAEEPPSRGRVLGALAEIGERYEAFGLRRGTFAGVDASGRLRLARGKGEVALVLDDRPFLLGLSGGRATPVASLSLWPGDRLAYRVSPAGRIDYLEVRPPVKGLSDDRSASRYAWEVRRTRAELERSINRRVAVGELRDLEVVERGVSGRIVALRVVGDRASAVVRGFDIRGLLDLWDLLTVIETQRDASGRLEAVVFSGKGWGHGVGLCQVGAYGMALRGKGYAEILAHYYRGAVLRKILTE